MKVEEKEAFEVVGGCPSLRDNFLLRMSPGETVVLKSQGFDKGILETRARECRWKFVSARTLFFPTIERKEMITIFLS